MTLTSRQKILIPLLVLVLLYLAWELSKTFDLFNTSPIDEKQTATAAAARKPFVPTQVSTIPANYAENQHAITLTENQKQYINLVAQYQRLQLEKMIAQNTQAIAAARLSAAEAQAKLAQVSYHSQQQVAAETPPSAASSKFQLVYTGQMGGHWTATLRRGSELLDVAAGDNLENGAKVIEVNGNQVILQKNNMQNIISFNGEQDVPVNKAAKSIVQTQPQQIQQMQPLPPDTGTLVSNSTSPLSNAMLEKIEKMTPVSADTELQARPLKMADRQKNIQNDENVDNQLPHETAAAGQKKKSVIASIPQIANTSAIATTAIQDKLADIPLGVSEKKKHHHHHELARSENGDMHHLRTESEKKLLSMDAKNFTVQLIGSHKKTEIDQYIIRHKLTDVSWQFRTTFRHRPWYALVFGKYSSVSQALAAIDDLPHPLKANKPFVRQIRVVQYEITRDRIPHAK